ncbi:MAG: N-6 DNA methylase, partial [Thermoguttaceae bacterium]|nr:N-6 DNA methylase [Thermoguttaceae bacterium]
MELLHTGLEQKKGSASKTLCRRKVIRANSPYALDRNPIRSKINEEPDRIERKWRRYPQRSITAGRPVGRIVKYPHLSRLSTNKSDLETNMITELNFKNLLSVLGFTPNGQIYEKQFSDINVSMSVDFTEEAKKLNYPPIRGRERNAGFDKPENFVVFECVNRLLEQGYRPEHIELEKEWHLGHDAKGGRADICVSDPSGKMLFIIECKTWGKQFEDNLNKTKNDGGQLFSYWQQELSCQWLVLYASDLKSGSIEYKALTINCSDDANIALLSQKDKSIKLYRDAHTAPDKFEVWKETYACHFHDDLIFSRDSVAYQIGVKPLRKKDLRDFSPDDKIVNKFEEILRHNNVSDKENAFNRLIALFICKLVDESKKGEDDEVEFQYKQGTDTYETLQDRLQRLHRDGMEQFMHEKILYVSSDYPEWLFSTYTGSKRKKAIEDLKNTIRILKFYSNNDFAFKDVHNEELFYQNGKILVEMVQLFEKYRIVYPSKHQFLGDLFEQLLNKGFKQNEGQFFTPIPVTRFIWDSLPVDRMVKSDRGTVYPKVIDYACGAGHFLTEAIEAINYFAQSDGNNAWVRDHIYGIEKDYRLARVAKISLFMNGAGEGNIIFGDGLENDPDKGIENGKFDILVANPPYSVKDFKQHLQLKNNSFTLLDRIGLNGAEIETLFVERIAQLLKPQGIAAVILPSSILSNDNSSYIGAREQILQNFYIRGIVAFGSKTFGATGTNTVVLFLEKFEEPPKKIDLCEDSVESIFGGCELSEWKDKDIFAAYVAQIEINDEVYKAFLNKSYSLENLETVNYFKQYISAFADSTEAKNLLKTRVYQNKSPEEQAATYLERFYNYVHNIEKEKLFYFSLVYQQTTVIITAPTDNKAQKDFLGYDWSNRKGNEGIQIITPGGKMYNDSDRAAKDTLAGIIRQSFNESHSIFKDEHKSFGAIISTKDMLDFSRVGFSKTLKLNTNKSLELISKYPQKNLFEIATLFRGVTYDKADQKPNETSNIVLTADNISLDGRFEVTKRIYIDERIVFSEDSRLKADDIFICMSSGSKRHVGKVAYIDSDTNYYAGGFMGIIRISTTNCIAKYLYYVLNTTIIKNILSGESSGSNINNLSNRIGTVKIPVPNIEIQKQIVAECEKIDDEYNTTRMSIENYRKKIEELFQKLDIISVERERE